MSKKITLIGLTVLLSVVLLTWLFTASTKPLPGEEAKQEGRDHMPEGSTLTYNFNPPTGGDHYASWITKGFYEESRHDGNLVHSLEHGYVVFWYNCERKTTMENVILNKVKNISFASLRMTEVFAHEGEATGAAQPVGMTAGSEGTVHIKLADMPKAFSDGSCDSFKNQIKGYIEKDSHKLIGMPRISMDEPLILTAWGRMLNLNSFDESKIKEFVFAFRDNGPEHTNEP